MQRWTMLALALGLCWKPELAHGTDSSADTETVVVTAQKRAEPLADVPMSITTATAAQLDQLGISSSADLGKIVPDFGYTHSPLGSPIFTIRGIGYFDDAIGAAPTVTVYMDQVPLPYSRMTQGAVLDLERVEVLKGPQGTLFGQNSTGGAINYIPARPTRTFESGVKLTAGRFGEFDEEGFVSGPLSDQWTARVAIRREKSGDWQQSVSRNDTLGARSFTNGRLLVDYRPNADLSLEFSASGWADRSDAQAGQFLGYSPTTPATQGGFTSSALAPNFAAQLQALASTSANDRAADWDPGVSFRRNDNFDAFSLRGELQVADNLSLTSITAYSGLRIDDPTDDDGTQVVNLRQLLDGDIRSFSQELRLAGQQQRIRWTAGANFQHDAIHDVQHFLNAGSNSGLFKGTPLEVRFSSGQNLDNQRVDSGALFGGADYDLTDKLTAQASARYTDTRRVFDGCLLDGGDGVTGRAFGLLSNVLNGMNFFPNPGDPGYVGPGGCFTLAPITNRPVNDVHQSVIEQNLSWRTGLAWKPEPAMLIYANATQGFKSGNFGTLVLLTPAQAAPVPAERLIAYEVGFRAGLPDRKVEVEGAAFYYDYRNKQLLGYVNTGVVFGNLPAEVSVPKSRVIGGEVSLTVRPLTGLSARVGVSHLNSKVTSDYLVSRPVSTTPPVEDIRGEAFPFTPEWGVVGILDYTRSLTPGWNAFVGGNVDAHSSTWSTFAPTQEFRISGYSLLDVRAGFGRDSDTLRVEFWGHNITNRYYWTDVSRMQDTIFRISGMPATYGVTVIARF